MKTLYIDCTNGICSDMVLGALLDMGMNLDCEARHELAHLCGAEHSHDGEMEHHHHHDHDHAHRSYAEVKHIIEHAPISPKAKELASQIYLTIAKAEAKVHGSEIETVHFHEVGRAEAIMNIISIAVCIEATGAEQILASDIHDGCGTIECSHGTIPVPVPAVMAIREADETARLGYHYVQEDIETELVTPSGLGIIVGLGAKHCKDMPEGSIISRGTGYGSRDTGKGGMEVYLIDASI